MSDRASLELHDRPLHGPMVEVYARQRAELIAELARRHEGGIPHEPAPAPANVCWRTLEGVSLCDEHALGLLDYGFVPDNLRPVWEESRITEIAAQTGMSARDIRRVHGHHFGERCAMCGVMPSANECLTCDKALHPNWPAVYCSAACALDDV